MPAQVPTPHHASRREPDRGFAEDLQILEKSLEKRGDKVTLAQLEELLEGRGFVTLVLILSLPFIQPIPVPGLSILFGLVILMLGLRVTLGHHAGLPAFLRKKELETTSVMRLTEAARKIFAKVEGLFRRRLPILLGTPGQNIAGLSLMLNGIALSLPLPPVILFSNGLPAFSVFLICLGLLERDGLFVLCGHALAILTWVYFGLWADLIFETLLTLPHLFEQLRAYVCHLPFLKEPLGEGSFLRGAFGMDSSCKG